MLSRTAFEGIAPRLLPRADKRIRSGDPKFWASEGSLEDWPVSGRRLSAEHLTALLLPNGDMFTDRRKWAGLNPKPGVSKQPTRQDLFLRQRARDAGWASGDMAISIPLMICHQFRSNEVRFWLSVLTYNLENPWRRLVLPRRIDGWTLTNPQQRLVNTGSRLVRYF